MIDSFADSWKYTCLTCAVHRRLSGRWRKSGLPVALCRHPKERPETYRLSLEAVHAEMQKLGLPPASQWHTDWAPGLGAAGRSVLPSIVHVPGMEHMIRNLNKKSLKTENGTRQAVPRLTARPLSVVSKYLYVIAGLPTLSLHVVALQVFLERVRVGWQEATWEQYFRKQYTYLARFVKADYGLEQATVGRWWFGMSSPLCHGHCSSQQQAEQSHKHLKRSLCDAKDRTVKEVLSTLVEAVDLWTDRSDEENSFHLFTSPGNTASFPTCPDDWMVDRMPKMFRVRAAGLGVKMLPCIQRLVEDAKRMPCIAERHKGRTRAFFMKTGTPAALPDATVERCWQQLQTKNLQELHALLTQHGLVKEMADGNKKMVYEAFCESWVEHCCVIHEQHRSRSTQVGDVQCSCWHYRRRGHCPHAYFVLQSRLGFKSWVPEVLPSAKAAPDALDMQSGGSSVEASKPGRSRKRKRPDYRPVPLPCPDVAVGEAARPVTKPRILQPQRAAKTRFSR
ncbi:unnamed protein product [Symbiodinium microadriaticum]|nr:unnamed protein product [Symbiodinium microadriaticum]